MFKIDSMIVADFESCGCVCTLVHTILKIRNNMAVLLHVSYLSITACLNNFVGRFDPETSYLKTTHGAGCLKCNTTLLCSDTSYQCRCEQLQNKASIFFFWLRMNIASVAWRRKANNCLYLRYYNFVTLKRFRQTRLRFHTKTRMTLINTKRNVDVYVTNAISRTAPK
jgi:hypothetical protein